MNLSEKIEARTGDEETLEKASASTRRAPLNGWCIGLLFLVLCGYVGSLEWVSPFFFLHDDNADYFSPAYRHDARTLFNTGELAEINYFQYGGEPFIGQAQPAVLYPPVYLCSAIAEYVLHDFRWTVDLLVLMHLAMGAAGLFLWLRRSEVDPLVAGLGSLLWVLSPFVILWTSNWLTFCFTAAYLPWIFLTLVTLLDRPGFKTGLWLALPVSLFFLSGPVEFVCYAVLSVAIWTGLRLWKEPWGQKVYIVRALMVSGALALALTLPVLCPVVQAMGQSVERQKALPLSQSLIFSLDPVEFVKTQFLHFGYESFHNINSVFFFCAGLFLLPLACLGFRHGGQKNFRDALSCFLLAGLALIFSTRAHALFAFLPLLSRFRFPFKLFQFAEFFFLVGLCLGLAGWIAGSERGKRWRRWLVAGLLGCILIINSGVVALFHQEALFNHVPRGDLHADVASLVDASAGRTLAVGDYLNMGDGLDRYLTHCFSTMYAIPNIGGYNPLASLEQRRFGVWMDVPNVFRFGIPPDMRELLDQRAVKYLLVNPDVWQGAAAMRLPDVKEIHRDAGRVILENLRAAPMVIRKSSSGAPEPIRYVGNSLFVHLNGEAGWAGVSLSNNEGWRYRVDRGPWQKATYEADRLWCMVPAGSSQLEVIYFDRGFREGLMASGLLLIVIFLGWMAAIRNRAKV